MFVTVRHGAMSNRTVLGAKSVRGSDPQFLIEKIIRERIYESVYWREECFGLNMDTLVDKALELRYVGGTFANQRPVPFLCLVLKMLQLAPDRDVVMELINHQDFKYVRLLGAFYLRLTGLSVDVYSILEPILIDYRKIKKRLKTGEYVLSFVDEVISELLSQERVFDVILPRLSIRSVLEEEGLLAPRVSLLTDEMLELEENEEIERAKEDQELKMESLSLKKPQKKESIPPKSASKDGSISIEETNALRAKLGLKPLKI